MNKKTLGNKKIMTLFFFSLLLLIFLIVFLCNKDSLNDLDNSSFLSISYVGSMNISDEQVKYSYDLNKKVYDFDYIFDDTKKYFLNSDFSFSSLNISELDDKLDDEGYSSYIDSIRRSGIDFLGSYFEGTEDYCIDFLKCFKNDGYYFNKRVNVINVKGVKMGVLSYSLPLEFDASFNEIKKSIEKDIAELKMNSVDLIVVMPYFRDFSSNSVDKIRDFWNDFFVSLGVDIILGNYSSSSQSISFKGDTFVVNSPGDFFNSFDNNGSAVVEILIDRNLKKIDHVSIVPLYSKDVYNGIYRVLSIADIYKNDNIFDTFDKSEIDKVNQINRMVTSSMIGVEVKSAFIQERYFLDKNQSDTFDLELALENSVLKNYLDESTSVAFIGDSITSGVNLNNYKGWYLDIIKFFPELKVYDFSVSGYTTNDVIKNFSNKIKDSNSGVYFLSVGVNDIRYRNSDRCAMDSREYIANIEKIISFIKNKNAKIILISPWYSLISDSIYTISFKEKVSLINDYSVALRDYALEKGFIYIDAYSYIENFMNNNNAFSYYVDFIHPNNDKGNKLYSYAVLSESIKN